RSQLQELRAPALPQPGHDPFSRAPDLRPAACALQERSGDQSAKARVDSVGPCVPAGINALPATPVPSAPLEPVKISRFAGETACATITSHVFAVVGQT